MLVLSKALPFDLSHAWFADENKMMLSEFIQTYKPKCIVELGSWLGASAIFMAKLMSQEGKLYAIDR